MCSYNYVAPPLSIYLSISEEAPTQDLLPSEKRKQIKEKKQVSKSGGGNTSGGRSNRLRTVFHEDTAQEIEARKQEAKKPFVRDANVRIVG